MEKTRTTSQNALYWTVLTELADEMLNKGIDLRAVIKDEVPIRPTKEALHANMGLALAKFYGKDSSTKLTTKEISQILNTICDVIRERTNGEVNINPDRPLTEEEAEQMFQDL